MALNAHYCFYFTTLNDLQIDDIFIGFPFYQFNRKFACKFVGGFIDKSMRLNDLNGGCVAHVLPTTVVLMESTFALLASYYCSRCCRVSNISLKNYTLGSTRITMYGMNCILN